MNAHDSERIKGTLESLGLGEAPSREGAEMDSGHGGQADPPPLLCALDDDVEDGRARNEQQGQRRHAEEPDGSRIRKDHGYHSGPCAGTT